MSTSTRPVLTPETLPYGDDSILNQIIQSYCEWVDQRGGQKGPICFLTQEGAHNTPWTASFRLQHIMDFCGLIDVCRFPAFAKRTDADQWVTQNVKPRADGVLLFTTRIGGPKLGVLSVPVHKKLIIALFGQGIHTLGLVIPANRSVLSPSASEKVVQCSRDFGFPLIDVQPNL